MKRSVGYGAVFCLMVVLGLTGVAQAAKGGKGAKSRDSVVAVAPSPCAHPGTYAVTGNGFTPGNRVDVTLSRQCVDGVTYRYLIWSGAADDSGAVSFSRQTESCTGIYIVEASERKGRGPSSKSTMTFIVY